MSAENTPTKTRIHIPLALEGRIEVLRSFGYTAGPRDPKMNSDTPGAFMVTEAGIPDDYPGQAGAGDGKQFYCVVGDNLRALVNETLDFPILSTGDINDFDIEDSEMWVMKDLDTGELSPFFHDSAAQLFANWGITDGDPSLPYGDHLAVPVMEENGEIIEVNHLYAENILARLKAEAEEGSPSP